jgi:hypothetical protein
MAKPGAEQSTMDVTGSGQARETEAVRLPPQLLSNLLWTAGVNRPDSGHRTAPSAHD